MKKTNILVIDDEESIGRLIKIGLEQTEAYTVDTVLSAEEGFAALGKNRYDVILLDVLMPRIEGGEALPRIKKMTDAPVIIISAYLLPEKLDAIRQAGAFSILEKPFSFEQVFETIHRALASREKERFVKNKR